MQEETAMRLLLTLALLGAAATFAEDTAPVAGTAVVRDTVTVRDTVFVSTPMTAYEEASIEQRKAEFAAAERAAKSQARRDTWQIRTWRFGFIAVAIGIILTWLRIRAMEEAAAAPHNDEMFRTFLERFADTGQKKNIRIASCIGLGYMTRARSRIATSWQFWQRDYPFRTPVIHLLVESIFTEDDPEVRNTIRDQLIEIGGPALQTLVDRHRENFPPWREERSRSNPRWLPLTHYDEKTGKLEIDVCELPPNFIASRDAIAGIVQKAQRGNVTSEWHNPLRPAFEWSVSIRKLRAAIRDWREYRRFTKRERWLDFIGFMDVSLISANLFGVNLWGANLWGANLSYANLSGANLWHATLDGANLWHANLFHASLYGAGLREANLSRSLLSSAGLSLANVQSARFANTNGIDQAIWPACNWWDAEEMPPDALMWLQEHYPREEHEWEFLAHWENADSGGYTDRGEEA